MFIAQQTKNIYIEINLIKVDKNAVMCLGIYILGIVNRNVISKNWMKIYHDMENLFESWKRRN